MRAVAATLVIVFTFARLAELHRSILLSISDDEYIIQTTILKSVQRIAEFKICKIPDERICPLRWFKSQFGDREPNIRSKVQELWSISYIEKYIQADDLSQAIRAVMQSAGIRKTYSVTSIRAAVIIKLPKYNVGSVQVDGFTHHSDITSIVGQYYDKNNITQKPYMYLNRRKKNSTMRKMKNKREHYQRRWNKIDPMSSRKQKDLLRFFLHI
ncbi:MAG: hypothetical protein EZS28_008638 [Streblomastix strix]|uniref:Tyr recombinase domain-containing protein n=1 Tax=Streblomastix strix TaxID=222440 RepID=A0A5J4WM22_9EUKA|nr:MAG: hypothetical protein EZS28_008638 [Streblomastix strix]